MSDTRKDYPDIQVESVGTSLVTKKDSAAEAEQYIPKPWLKAPGQPCGEKCEICTFKCIFYFPVIVTFSIFFFLVTYYVFVSLLMTILINCNIVSF